jgi:hypothetical protein
VARELLGAVDVAEGVRLLGISGQQLVRRPPDHGRAGAADDQGQLFDEAGAPSTAAAAGSTRQAAVERSLDEIRAKFGSGAVGPGGANSLQREGPRPPAR